MLDGSGTGVSPVCWLHDSRGRDARAWGLDISLNDLGNWARRWRLGLFLGTLDLGRCPRLVWGGPLARVTPSDGRTRPVRVKNLQTPGTSEKPVPLSLPSPDCGGCGERGRRCVTTTRWIGPIAMNSLPAWLSWRLLSKIILIHVGPGACLAERGRPRARSV